MLQNAYFLAKIGADTAENERHFAENLPKIGNYPTGPATRRRGTQRQAGPPPAASSGRRPRGARPASAVLLGRVGPSEEGSRYPIS